MMTLATGLRRELPRHPGQFTKIEDALEVHGVLRLESTLRSCVRISCITIYIRTERERERHSLPADVSSALFFFFLVFYT